MLEKDDILIDTLENGKIIVSPIRRNGKIIGSGIWLTQGDPIDTTNFWISADEIDKFIKSLEKAKKSLNCIYKQCKNCYHYYINEFTCDLLDDDFEVNPNETCNLFVCKENVNK
jgi:hypothetical protein